MWGISRGSEAALLLGLNYPDLVHGVIADSPSSVLHGGIPDPATSAWTLAGRPVVSPTPDIPAIPVDQINAPILTLCGGADLIWPSCRGASNITTRTAIRAHAAPVVHVDSPSAGHAYYRVAVTPLEPPPDPRSAVYADGLSLGGTYGADAAATTAARATILRFLETLPTR